MDPTGNFCSYRSSLQAAMSSIAQDKQQVMRIWLSLLTLIHVHYFIQISCVIPVFSLLLKDIYFLNQGNKNKFSVSSMYPC